MPLVERRLQRRYLQLVQEHLHVATEAAHGLSALPGPAEAFAATQAAWRFYANDRVSLPELARPLIEEGRRAAAASPAGVVLLAHDWSTLGFGSHASKADRLQLTHARDVGYELATALLIDAATGGPLAPMALTLRAADGLHSTRPEAAGPVAAHVDQVAPVMAASTGWDLAKPVVHVIDREADSVGHYRRWAADGHRFVVRADAARAVRWGDRETTLPAVVAELVGRGEFRDLGAVDCRGTPTTQSVAEAVVVLHKPARRRVGGKQVEEPGEPLPLRLVVSRLRDEAGEVRAEWLLLTNVAAEDADAAAIASWYLARWRIESYFKLVKSAGQHLERWQQESAEAIARRLAVASMACVLVWRLARATSPEAERMRGVLVRLSGRQMKWGKSFTEPALLAGLRVLLAMLELLDEVDLDELRAMARDAVPFWDSS